MVIFMLYNSARVSLIGFYFFLPVFVVIFNNDFVLSFHRLEDRIVKNLFRVVSKPFKKMVDRKESHVMPILKLIAKKPLVPTLHETRINRRARSGKLRVGEKI